MPHHDSTGVSRDSNPFEEEEQNDTVDGDDNVMEDDKDIYCVNKRWNYHNVDFWNGQQWSRLFFLILIIILKINFNNFKNNVNNNFKNNLK